MFQKFMKLLFTDQDHICYGDFYATKVTKQPTEPVAEFFSINPLDSNFDYVKEPNGTIVRYSGEGRRADLNVTRFQNFLFEMDNTPLDEQLKLLEDCKFPWASIVYSGGKSYHAILSLEIPLNLKPHTQESVEEYKKVWRQLATVLTTRVGSPLSLIDTSCQNPSRLSRLACAQRAGVEQHIVKLGKLCTEQQLQEILREAPEMESIKIQKNTRTASASTDEEMRMLMPIELLNRLKYPASWAQGAAGNYPHLFKLVLWLIDATGAPKELVVRYLEQNTFPALARLGYPEDKMYKVVNDAFNLKGGSQ